MCNTHHKIWRRAHPGFPTLYEMTVEAVAESLPGTLVQLIAKSGMCREAVNRALGVLRAGGDEARAHIGSFTTPTSKGTRFMPVYVAGPGEDASMSKTDRRLHRNATERRAHRTRKTKAEVRAVPQASAWAASLLAGLDLTTPMEEENEEDEHDALES